MAIRHRPKVGELLECNFGRWADTINFDGHITPEMRKRRLVVVLNGNLDGKSSLIVPISSSESNNPNSNEINSKEYYQSTKYHHFLPTELFEVTDFYDKRDRWALCERVQVVSNDRLFYVFNKNDKISQYLPFETVRAIQLKVIHALNAHSIITELEEKLSKNDSNTVEK